MSIRKISFINFFRSNNNRFYNFILIKFSLSDQFNSISFTKRRNITKNSPIRILFSILLRSMSKKENRSFLSRICTSWIFYDSIFKFLRENAFFSCIFQFSFHNRSTKTNFFTNKSIGWRKNIKLKIISIKF